MPEELPKSYEPSDVEPQWYNRWVDANCFHGDENSDAEPYSIVIPPPNVTGILHLGHVLNNTIQDILARRARMQGKSVCWLPGTDHAGIATQSKVEKELRKNEKLTRHDLGRDKFLEKVWEYKETHSDIIIQQLKRLGCSCDWERQRFTMDEDYTRWISKIFVDLYNDGLIYRGKRMVNWCPKSLTALSDEEVIMKPQKSKLYYMRYEIADEPGRFVEIATTRPETIPGDSGIAVNPKDERYADLVGKMAIRPFPRAKIPIVADEHIDIEFGTGVLKVTPAHDKADFEIGMKNGLEVIDVFNPDATLNELAGPDLEGLDRFAARKKAAEMLDAMGALIREEDYENNVGFSERADVPIEPRISMQWFLKYPKTEEAAAAVASDEITFRPARWKKTFAFWMDGLQDWCISRQLWWGHQIPVWYRKDNAEELQNRESLDAETAGSEIHVGIDPPADEENWVRDGDVLDTWFSSWLWPFATMTGSEGHENGDRSDTFKKFYPTTDLVTGPDIIFFWVARMIMAGYRWENELPFKNVFFTSIIRDGKGRKLSKSLGNSPDPLDIIADLGADALRFSIMKIAPLGSDIRFNVTNEGGVEKYPQVEEGRNFATKMWNAARYRQMQEAVADADTPQSIYTIDILAKLDALQVRVEKGYDDYKFSEITQALYEFFWSEFCDWYLESSKGDTTGDAARTMDIVFERYLMLLHPFMPHLSEELWEKMGFATEGKFLMNTPIPTDSVLGETDHADAQKKVETLYEAVGRARNLKAEYNLASNRNITFILDPTVDWIGDEAEVFARLAGAKSIDLQSGYEAATGVPVALTDLGKIYMPLEGLIDVDAEKARISKVLEKTEKELKGIVSKLNNENFVSRAPDEVVQENRDRKKDLKAKVEELGAMLAALG